MRGYVLTTMRHDIKASLLELLAEGAITIKHASQIAGISRQAVLKWVAHMPGGSQDDRCRRYALRRFNGKMAARGHTQHAQKREKIRAAAPRDNNVRLLGELAQRAMNDHDDP